MDRYQYQDVVAFVIRHGERCDNSPLESEQQKVKVQWDPPLTAEGHEQAKITGKHLLKLLKEANI